MTLKKSNNQIKHLVPRPPRHAEADGHPLQRLQELRHAPRHALLARLLPDLFVASEGVLVWGGVVVFWGLLSYFFMIYIFVCFVWHMPIIFPSTIIHASLITSHPNMRTHLAEPGGDERQHRHLSRLFFWGIYKSYVLCLHIIYRNIMCVYNI